MGSTALNMIQNFEEFLAGYALGGVVPGQDKNLLLKIISAPTADPVLQSADLGCLPFNSSS
jgi:hypothetical protein